MKKPTARGLMTTILAVSASAALMFSPAASAVALADYEIMNNNDYGDGYPSFFDLSDRVMTIRAGESAPLTIYSRYNYTYFVAGTTVPGTYVECTQNAGTEKAIVHISPNETKRNIFLYFYYDNSRNEQPGNGMTDGERYASVEVYVQPAAGSAAQAAAPAAAQDKAKAAAQSVTVGMAGGKSGTLALVNDKKVAMLQDDKGTALASFSVSDGTGNMPTLSLGGAHIQDGKAYFTVSTQKKGAASIKISDSDKKVMVKRGFSGVCLNGTYLLWP